MISEMKRINALNLEPAGPDLEEVIAKFVTNTQTRGGDPMEAEHQSISKGKDERGPPEVV